MLIFGNKKQTSQKYYFLNNVGLQAKSQPLLSTNEKKRKMSVRTFLPRALHMSGPAKGFGCTVSGALLIQVCGIFLSQFGCKVSCFSWILVIQFIDMN